jgi:hypothetical protein
MLSVITENADIKTFFESKMCDDVFKIVNDFAKPHLFEVGDEIEVYFTWKDSLGNIVNEYNYYEIMEIDRTTYPSKMLVEELASGGVSLFYQSQFYDNEEEEEEAWGKPQYLIINTDENGDEYTTSFSHYNDGNDYEWENGEGYYIEKKKFEAKQLKD